MTTIPAMLIVFVVSGILSGSPRDRPNILFIMSDDHAWQAISAYGRPDGTRINRTPGIDRIAEEGLRFDRCFVENAICAPSRAAFLTGCFSSRHGVPTNAERFDGTQPTWPALLQANGYRTGIFGKWHLKSEPVGFDEWKVLIGQGPYYNPPMKSPSGIADEPGYTTDVITNEGVEALRRFATESRETGRPFALLVQHKAPHREWAPPLRHLELFETTSIPEPPTLLDDYRGRSVASTLQTMSIAHDLTALDLKLTPPRRLDEEQLAAWNAHYEPLNRAYLQAIEAGWLSGDAETRAKYQRYVKDYLRCVTAVDEGVAQLLDELDALGIAEDTIVVYTSDQGWYLGEHGWYDKRWMYEESFRTPFVVRWPGHIPAETRSDLMIQNIDLAPTLLDLAGVEAPARMHGRSFADLLRSGGQIPPENWRDAVYYRYYESDGPHTVPKHDGVRTARWKLIHFPEIDEDAEGPMPAGVWELYDLESDPDEMRNLADIAEYADVRARLTETLETLRSRYEH